MTAAFISVRESGFLLCSQQQNERHRRVGKAIRRVCVDCCGLRATRLRAARLCPSVGAVRLVVLACFPLRRHGRASSFFSSALLAAFSAYKRVRGRPRGEAPTSRTSRERATLHVHVRWITTASVVRCRSHPRLKERSASVLEAVEKPHEFGRITHHGIATWLRRHEGQGAGRAQAARALAAHAS